MFESGSELLYEGPLNQSQIDEFNKKYDYLDLESDFRAVNDLSGLNALDH